MKFMSTSQYYKLAMQYKNGRGVQKNWAKTVEILDKAAEHALLYSEAPGNRYETDELKIKIAKLYMKGGYGLPVSYEQAFYNLSIADRLGNKEATRRFHKLQEIGDGYMKWKAVAV